MKGKKEEGPHKTRQACPRKGTGAQEIRLLQACVNTLLATSHSASNIFLQESRLVLVMLATGPEPSCGGKQRELTLQEQGHGFARKDGKMLGLRIDLEVASSSESSLSPVLSSAGS